MDLSNTHGMEIGTNYDEKSWLHVHKSTEAILMALCTHTYSTWLLHISVCAEHESNTVS